MTDITAEVITTKPTKGRETRYAKNLLATWFCYAANMMAIFFLSPFVVQSLGEVNYGVWSLMASLTGYLGLIELGTQAGIGRFINYHLGKGDIAKVNGIVNTGLAIFLVIGVLLFIVSGILAWLLPQIFNKIPVALMPDARIICFLVAINLWISLISAPLRLVMQAHERFELTNGVDLVVLILRTGLTILALMNGLGLVAFGLIQVTSNLFGLSCLYKLARKVMPQLAIRSSMVKKERFDELLGFSIWAFVGSMGYRLLFCTDTIVIAMLLGPKWVTYFVIGDILIQKAADLVTQSLSVFAPKIVQDCANGNIEELRNGFRRSTSLGMAIGVLLAVGLIGFGKEFITLWMGPQFGISYPILVILCTSWLFTIGYSAAIPYFSGLHYVRFSGLIILAQGLSNLALSLLFVVCFHGGIEGVAWGTFYPRIGFSIACVLFVARLIELPARELIATALRWLILSGSFYSVCVLINMYSHQSNWKSFLIKVSVATVVYAPLAWLLLLSREERSRQGVVFRSIARRFTKAVDVVE